MDQISQILEFRLFGFGDGAFTLANVLLILLIVLVAWLLNRILERIIVKAKSFRGKALSAEQKNSLQLTRRSLVFLFAVIAVLLSLPADELFTITEDKVHVMDLINIVLVFVLARILVWYLKRWFQRLAENKKVNVEPGRSRAISQIFSYVIYVLAVLLALTSLKIDINLIIASTAGLFVGVGLALQHTIDDVMSGIIILFDGTLEVGDMVVVDSLGLEGKVMEIRLRSTVVETLDHISVIVPNSQITKNNVVNWSFNDSETRFRVSVSVAYGSDLQLVRKVLISSAQSHGKILKKPAPKVWFMDFGDSGLLFEVLFWSHHEREIYEIKSDLRFKIEAEFRRHGITIPFPQRDLHLVSDRREQFLRDDEQ
jgi:small-conductance mechanosensitive channel